MKPSSVQLILGPVFFSTTLFLIGKAPLSGNYDLVFIATLGLLASARWHLKGAIASIISIGILAGIKFFAFGLLTPWVIGVYASIALSLLITCLVLENESKQGIALEQKAAAHEKTIGFLEEDLSRLKEESSGQISQVNQRLMELQTQLEEEGKEVSCYRVLNELLRKSHAKSLDEKKQFESRFLSAQRREYQLLKEVDDLSKELQRLSNESSLVKQNQDLFLEINELRFHLQQAKFLQDSFSFDLRKLKSLEEERVEIELFIKGLEAELESKKDLTVTAEKEEALLKKISLLEDDLANAQKILGDWESKKEELILQIATREEKHLQEKESLSKVLDELKRNLDFEKLNFEAKEKLLSDEIVIWKNKAIATEQTLDKIKNFTPDHLYKQLKLRFEEKKHLLHQTRCQLFKADTELQTLHKTLEHQESDPIPDAVLTHLESLEEENYHLHEERVALQDLVSKLIVQSGESLRKKPKEKVESIELDLFS
jgi:hypothetical protein